MVEIFENRGGYYLKNSLIIEENDSLSLERMNALLEEKGIAPLDTGVLDKQAAKTGTMAWDILQAHNTGSNREKLEIKYDAMASHDITYVGIIQTARASGLKEFPIPYVLTNCHNSLCAVGGTINEDDHRFGLSAAKKYGGIFVPAHQAVIHQYMREMMSGCGKMILGSDSHTRYGALGTLAVGEGGPELVKQLLNRTYNIDYPGVVAVYLEGAPVPGVGPQDVALAIIKAVFDKGYVKNKVMEFIGPGIANLSVDYRMGIDVMTTETTCLSSIWCTDEPVKEYYEIHNRPEAFKFLHPKDIAYYDGVIKVDLSRVEPMIALPFHPSNAFPITEVNSSPKYYLDMVENAAMSIFTEKGERDFHFHSFIEGRRIKFNQGVVAGCAGGTFENIFEMAKIMGSSSIGHDDFSLSIYPSSQPVSIELVRQGIFARLMSTGAIIRSAFCGPCFGAGDTPANSTLSARHSTRNFPNREGSKPGNGQLSAVALMDARSVAATAIHNGRLTAATELNLRETHTEYNFDGTIYSRRVYSGFATPFPDEELRFGPNIRDWPQMIALPENLLLQLAAVITDPVTTTDELIPSGETSSFRSNPEGLAEFTLSRKVPEYVARAKKIREYEASRRLFLEGGEFDISDYEEAVHSFFALKEGNDSDLLFIKEQLKSTGLGSIIYARKPGDGSAREQAASCQKVLGGWGNLAQDYATKRYRSNLINWGMLPFVISPEWEEALSPGDFLYLPGIGEAIRNGAEEVSAVLIGMEFKQELTLALPRLTEEERRIILAGCLINDYKQV